MCGRYVLSLSVDSLALHYDAKPRSDFDPWVRHYNIPPREYAPVLLQQGAEKQLHLGYWGYIPGHVKDLAFADKYHTHNAQSEKALESRLYREAFLHRRCIIPAESFIEWIGESGHRIPLNLARADGKPLSLAGIWSISSAFDRPNQVTFSVLTTHPSEWMKRIHDRMPVIIADEQIERWLSPTLSDEEELRRLCARPAFESFAVTPLDPQKINTGRTDDPSCRDPSGLKFEEILQKSQTGFSF